MSPGTDGISSDRDRRREGFDEYPHADRRADMVLPTDREVHLMYVRVVRFTDASPDRIEEVLARVKESGGPPPGVSTSRLQLLSDPEHSTAVVLQYFETADDMAAATRVFDAMDASETPGTRASVDTCEVKLDLARS
jgi:hypothetical protein